MPGIDPETLSGIPIIDFAAWGDGTDEDAQRIGQEFYRACRDVGFAYCIGHGVPDDVIDDMFSWSKRFFALPQAIKEMAPHPPEGWYHRGYSGVGKEQVSQMVFDKEGLAAARTNAPDLKESFEVGNDQRLKNIWVPEADIPGFRAQCERFFAEAGKFQTKVLRALGLGMPGLYSDFFDSYHTELDNQLRLLHYPAAPAELFESSVKGRIAAHTDFGTGTLLWQDDVGGLEVEDPHKPGEFLAAPPIPGAIVFNIGDLLMRWSNDELKSTLHRVRAPPADESGLSRERYSIPYFIGADRTAVIDVLPGSVAPDRPSKRFAQSNAIKLIVRLAEKYGPIVAGDYTNMRLNATYAV